SWESVLPACCAKIGPRTVTMAIPSTSSSIEQLGSRISRACTKFTYHNTIVNWKNMVPVSVELFAYPWDIVDSGVEPFVEYCSQAGIHRIHAAVTYHSGKFLLPRNSRSRIYFPEPGARYFRDSGTPGNGGLSQPVSSLADTGWLESLATEAYGKGIEL